MGASSVTGVSGHGTVAGVQKGSEHMSLGVERLVGPRHVYVGKVTLAAGAATLEIPLPTTDVDDYVVQATNMTGDVAVGVDAFAIDADTKVATIGIAGTGTDVVAVTVLKVGYAGALVPDAGH